MHSFIPKALIITILTFVSLAYGNSEEDIDKNSETISVETSEDENPIDNKSESEPKPIEKKEVEKKEVGVKSKATKKKIKKSWSVAGSCNNCIRFSTGVTYLFFSQKPPENLNEVEYKNFVTPSILVEGFYRFIPGWRARFEYVSHPSVEFQSNSPFLNNSASWSYLAVGADWNAIKPMILMKHGWVPKIYATYQMHSLPYVKQIGQAFNLSNENVDTVSVGFHLDIGKPRSKRSYFFSQRVQFPVNSSGQLKWGSGFGYEGSIGLSTKFDANWSWNIFWGGQYHAYQYTDGPSSGEYKIGNSMLSIGIGYLN